MTNIYTIVNIYNCERLHVQINFIKNYLKSRSIAYTQYLLPICATK
jgi:hypothetical protein